MPDHQPQHDNTNPGAWMDEPETQRAVAFINGKPAQVVFLSPGVFWEPRYISAIGEAIAVFLREVPQDYIDHLLAMLLFDETAQVYTDQHPAAIDAREQLMSGLQLVIELLRLQGRMPAATINLAIFKLNIPYPADRTPGCDCEFCTRSVH